METLPLSMPTPKPQDAIFEASEAQLRLLTDAVPALICYVDAEQRYRFNNRAYAEWFGRSAAELHGQHVREVLGAQAYQAIAERIRVALSGQRVSYETVVPHRDGGTRVVHASYVPDVDGGGRVRGFFVVAHDITELKRSEEAQVESQRRLRFALESASIGDWDIDVVSGEVARSAEHARCFGESEPAQPWTYQKFLAAIHPDDRSQVERLIEEALARRQPWHVECRVIWPDGSVHWIEASGVVYRVCDGEPRRAAGIVRDITSRKRSEEERREVEARLREANERLRSLTAHLEKMLEAERLRIARELHDDLGSTLAGIKWAVALAIGRAEETGSRVGEQLGQAMRLLDSAVDTMRRIIIDLRPSVLDQLGVWATIQWYADLIQERTGLHCEVAVAAEIADCTLDAERSTAVFRIVQEALTNVVRHAHAKNVSIRIDRFAHELLLEVHDDGIGIRDEALINTESWGLIGMQERASRFGGEVRVTAAPGDGTTLVLRMPM